MADALSDIVTLTNAFGQFSNSVTQLHNTRVQMETAAKQSLINKSRYDFLQRFNKPLGDPDRIELDEDSPNYWRDALSSHESEVESYLGSIKNKNVQNSVRQQLSGANQSFAIELSNTLASAEVKETQDKLKNTFRLMSESGQGDEAIDLIENTQKAIKVFSPSEYETFERQELNPLKASRLAGMLNSAATSAVPVMDKEGQVIGERRVANINSAISAASDLASNPTPQNPASISQMAMSNLVALRDENDKRASVDIKRLKAMQDAGDVIPIDYIEDLAASYSGNVSYAIESEILGYQYEARKTDAITAMNVYTTGVISRLGSADGTKFVDPALGFAALEKLYSPENIEAARSNSAIADAMESNASKIRALMAGTTDERKAVFESKYTNQLVHYKAGLVDATELATTLFQMAPLISPDEFIKYSKQLEEASLQDPAVQDFMKDSSLLKEMYDTALSMKDPNSKEILNMMNGKGAENQWFSTIVTDIMTQYKAQIRNGTHMDPGTAKKMFRDQFASELANIKSGVYDIPKQQANDLNTHKSFGKIAQDIATGRFMGDGYDVYGKPVSSVAKAGMMDIIAPIAVQTVFQAEGKKYSLDGFIPIRGKDGKAYITHRDWGNTVYEMSGDGRGIVMTEYRVAGATKTNLQWIMANESPALSKPQSGGITANSATYAPAGVFENIATSYNSGWWNPTDSDRDMVNGVQGAGSDINGDVRGEGMSTK